MFIPITQPFNLVATLESGQAFRWRRVGDWFHGVVVNNIVKMKRLVRGIEFISSPDEEAYLMPFIVEYLGLNQNLDVVYESISKDEFITESIDKYRGMRILCQDPWECLISFICSSASNIPRISRNLESISSEFGKPLQMDNYERRTFPTPDDLAGVKENKLEKLKLGYRSAYVISTARMVAEGKIDLNALREKDYEEALNSLVVLDGVGDKVANCVLLFSLGKTEAFPVDVWVQRVLRENYLAGKSMSLVSARRWAMEFFGPYAGYANQYLFHNRRLQGKRKM